MIRLGLATLWHRKLRTTLTATAVAIGVAMLVTMSSLSRGTLQEVADRVKSVDAELVAMPAKSSAIFSDGAPLKDTYIDRMMEVRHGGESAVAKVLPVFISMVSDMAGQQQRVFGVSIDDFQYFVGKKSKLVAGELFPGGKAFRDVIASIPREKSGAYTVDRVDENVFEAAQELIIDDRLATAGKYRVGDEVEYLGRKFRICGIVQAGVAGRVFVSIDVLRHLQTSGAPWSSLYFIRLNPNVVAFAPHAHGMATTTTSQNAGKISQADVAKLLNEKIKLRIDPLERYDAILADSFKSMYLYVDMANLIVLIVSFLFIMVTIYTIMLERRREVGVLRSLGADSWYVTKLTVFEAMMISGMGTLIGIALSFAGKFAIEHYRPLLTVAIETKWVVLAVIVGAVGGLASSLYPAWQASRMDPVECLTYE
jgi:ABC-type antimicrobial peptide transport system permease subunit